MTKDELVYEILKRRGFVYPTTQTVRNGTIGFTAILKDCSDPEFVNSLSEDDAKIAREIYDEWNLHVCCGEKPDWLE